MLENISFLRDSAQRFYKSVGGVQCPYLKETVHFTAEGFSHIRYRSGKGERHYKVQSLRYKLLSFAPILLKYSHTLQEFEFREMFFDVEAYGQRTKSLKMVRFFGFIGIIRGWKIKVIVRQVGNGQKHFWSIIPNWKTRSVSDSKKAFQNFTGDLLED